MIRTFVFLLSVCVSFGALAEKNGMKSLSRSSAPVLREKVYSTPYGKVKGSWSIKNNKAKQNKNPRMATYSDFMGRYLIGTDVTAHWVLDFSSAGGGNVTMTGLSGSTDFQLDYNTCNGGFVYSCYSDVTFTPTSPGLKTAVLGMTWLPAMSGATLQNVSTTFTAIAVVDILRDECRAIRKGSVVDIDNHSVSESVGITGTEFSLVYSSTFTGQYKGTIYPNVALAPSFNPEAWSVSVVHKYDSANNGLFLGSGTRLTRTAIPGSVSGQVYVVNGDDVYVFDSAGKHLQTKSYLTGYVKYNFTYTAQNKIWKITDAFSNVTTFNRNVSGVLTSISSPYGHVTTIVPTSAGLIGEIQDPNLNSYKFTYYSGQELIEVFEKPNGVKKYYEYEESSGWLHSEVGDGGNGWGTFAELDENGSNVEVVDAMLRNSTWFEIRKNPTTGQYTRTEQSPAGFITTFIGNLDRSQSMTNLYKTVTSSTSNDERFGSILPRVSQVQETIGSLTKTTQFLRTTSLSNSADPYSYTQIVDTRDVNGNQWVDTFVKATGVRTSVTPMNITTTTQLDAYERPVSTQLGSDTAMGFQYDILGRVLKTTQGTGHDTDYEYDSNGNLISVTNALNEKTQYAYDSAGRKTSITYPDLRVTQIAYSPNGQITGVTPPGRPIHSLTFNLFEEPETYAPPTLSGVSVVNTVRSYNLAKQLTNIQRPDGRNLEFIYSNETLLERIKFSATDAQVYTYFANTEKAQYIESPQGVLSEFTYLDEDNILSEKQTLSTEDSKVNFTYDNFFRKTNRSLQFDGVAVGSVNTTYRSDNKPTQIGIMDLDYDTTSGRITTTAVGNIEDLRTYDTYGNLASYSSTYQVGSGTPVNLFSYTLTRDSIHRVVAKSETVQGVTTTYAYTYDSSGRLSTVTKNGVAHSSYTYNSNSNRTSGTLNGVAFTGSYDNQDRVTAFMGLTYQYNANGELSEITNVSTSASTIFTTDTMGRITNVVTPTSVAIDYKLDWDGRINTRFVNSVSQSRMLWESKYQLAAEKIVSTGQIREYVYGLNVNSPDYMKVGATTYRILKDYLGSPRLIVRTSDGLVMQKMNYNEWGKVIEDTNPGFQPFGFAGGLYDLDSQLVHFGARDYDPETGRWTSKDPIGFDGGDTNLYGYVLQDPINFVDPSGHFAWVWPILRPILPIIAPYIPGIGEIVAGIGAGMTICEMQKDEGFEETVNDCYKSHNKRMEVCRTKPFGQDSECFTESGRLLAICLNRIK